MSVLWWIAWNRSLEILAVAEKQAIVGLQLYSRSWQLKSGQVFVTRTSAHFQIQAGAMQNPPVGYSQILSEACITCKLPWSTSDTDLWLGLPHPVPYGCHFLKCHRHEKSCGTVRGPDTYKSVACLKQRCLSVDSSDFLLWSNRISNQIYIKWSRFDSV